MWLLQVQRPLQGEGLEVRAAPQAPTSRPWPDRAELDKNVTIPKFLPPQVGMNGRLLKKLMGQVPYLCSEPDPYI